MSGGSYIFAQQWQSSDFTTPVYHPLLRGGTAFQDLWYMFFRSGSSVLISFVPCPHPHRPKVFKKAFFHVRQLTLVSVAAIKKITHTHTKKITHTHKEKHTHTHPYPVADYITVLKYRPKCPPGSPQTWPNFTQVSSWFKAPDLPYLRSIYFRKPVTVDSVSAPFGCKPF